ncbi:TRNA-dihydrouridine(47) synthase [NAD(P)(+)] [Aphelenchoides besseyi]|nr:TRNA-dihydrouridine(47) synthase [NAD(P)(+)] [Aphelenchoides besseyi]
MEEVKTEVTTEVKTEVVVVPTRTGIAAIKKEFLRLTNVEVDEPKVEKSENAVGTKPRSEHRGMDRKREKKMSQARAEVRSKTARLCPSLIHADRECRYGAKCNAEHSIETFMQTKTPDLGDQCVIYEATGKCQFSVACRFASAHTGADFTQLTKEPKSDYQPIVNMNTVPLQKMLRKHEFDFSKSQKFWACAEYANRKADDPPVGVMEREELKLDMRSLAGKRYLAPLTTVGNLPFRRLCVDLGAEITCGEMAMATQLLQGSPSEWTLTRRHPCEKIFGVQLAGGYPDTLSRAAQVITEKLDVDFIDLNLGCPIDAVNDKGGGCSLANRSNKLLQVIPAMQYVMGSTPLTIKMRYGLKENDYTAHHIIRKVVENCPPQLITLHPRSKEQRYSKLAEWHYVPKCIEATNKKTPLWVCGDVYSWHDYYDRLESSGIDGIMIGRGALIKPWLFTEIDERRDWDITASERLELIRKYVNYGLEYWGSDDAGVENTRRFLLEWMSFHHRYVPLGLLEYLPARMNEKPPPYFGRSDLETLLASKASSDWVKVTEMFLGKVPDGHLFVPKHRANAW